MTAAVAAVDGVTGVKVDLDVMSETQRKELQGELRSASGAVEREIPFAQPGSLTRVYAVASGKGGVGKSSVTVNLAAAMAARRACRSASWTPTSTATRSRGCSASRTGRPRSRT